MYKTLYANKREELLDHPDFTMLGRTGKSWAVPEPYEMIPLPQGASLVLVPHCMPVGMRFGAELSYIDIDSSTGETAYAVAALLPQGFTRTYLPAGVSRREKAEIPLLGYAAVGFKDGKIFTAAVQTDEHRKWHPRYYNTSGLDTRINRMLNKFPQNRIYRQLAYCSAEYSCFTAQNIFYRRWEGGIPTTPRCNADCVACISQNHASPQQRLSFKPSCGEIVQAGSNHLTQARDGIISFGQGCEGDPALNANDLSEAVRGIRAVTDAGCINMNTNAGYTAGIEAVCDAGVDSLRITIFSALEENYNIYHRPRGYSWADVLRSIDYAKDKGVSVSVNLLTFPGFTDQAAETEAWLSFIKRHDIDMLQLRNLNIDPDFLTGLFSYNEAALGIPEFIQTVQTEIPHLTVASYTHPLR